MKNVKLGFYSIWFKAELDLYFVFPESHFTFKRPSKKQDLIVKWFSLKTCDLYLGLLVAHFTQIVSTFMWSPFT